MATVASKIIAFKDVGMPRRLSPEASRMAALEAERFLATLDAGLPVPAAPLAAATCGIRHSWG